MDQLEVSVSRGRQDRLTRNLRCIESGVIPLDEARPGGPRIKEKSMSSTTSADELPREFLTHAKRLFAERGFDHVSFEELAREGGIPTAQLEVHFATKEELYAELIEEIFDAMRARVYDTKILQESTVETFWAIIARSWRRSAEHMLEHPEDVQLWREYQRRWRHDTQTRVAGRLRKISSELSLSLARRGQELGCVRRDLTPEQITELVEAVDFVTDTWFFEVADARGDAYAFDHQTPISLDIIWRMLAPVEALCTSR